MDGRMDEWTKKRVDIWTDGGEEGWKMDQSVDRRVLDGGTNLTGPDRTEI